MTPVRVKKGATVISIKRRSMERIASDLGFLSIGILVTVAIAGGIMVGPLLRAYQVQQDELLSESPTPLQEPADNRDGWNALPTRPTETLVENEPWFDERLKELQWNDSIQGLDGSQAGPEQGGPLRDIQELPKGDR